MHISKNQIKLVRSLRQKKFRESESLFVAEGIKCISELVHRFEVVWVVSSHPEHMAQLSPIPILEATEKEIEQMSSLQTPQGVIGVFRLPSATFNPNILLSACLKDLILVLDGIQDPGNMGTIIRTADWFGIRHIVCSETTADAYNPKTVQATMGALARVQIYYTPLYAFLQSVRKQDLPIYGTLLEGKNIYQQSLRPQGVIVMGNEGNGISDEVRPLISNSLLIPSYPAGATTSESLNVAIATAITLSEFRSRTSTL
ncbi:MAG: RNA methyltransferase [Paludibacter sp.]|nr:RNA methyltransferase [Bacteroidales bacterium]MCM1069274.1 RNA methyltransferase [Prevotella sp.]MCM1353743.1 RNA methyltransferase [Bacteroides sp.]MCM1442189.1 RNA methyltransferase [Muribaculum sp.]MCM1482151.1 RNA methyltransferase [Paludibacter sp.]